MVDYLKIVAEVEAKMAAKSTPPPVESTEDSTDEGATDTQQAPGSGPEDAQQAPDLDAWRRECIAREQSTWTPERRQTHEGELRRVEAYRRQRGPAPSGPSPGGGIPRSEVFARISKAMERLGKIWPCGLYPNPTWQARINAAAEGPRQTFLDTVKEWEQAETARVNAHLYAITRIVAGWPDECRRRFSIMVESFMRAERGQGITVRALSKNAAISKAFFDMRPFIPDDTPTDSPAPDDGLPFHDLHPNTREILLRHWNTWDAARRARFIEGVEGVMRKTGYSEGNACAFILQTAGPVAPAQKPAMTEADKAELHAKMWPTPPGKPQPKPTGQDVDIGKIVSTWPKPLRMKYAGLVGRYSNEMPLVEAMARAYAELQSTAKEN